MSGLKIDEKYEEKIDSKQNPVLWIQKVETGSPADKNGCMSGDGLL